jgi:hypothetical protein
MAFVMGEKEYNAAKNSEKGQVVSILSDYYSAP